MILEAKYWNQELNRQKIDFVNAAERYVSLGPSEEDTDALDKLNFALERPLFFSAFCVRKLIEADQYTRQLSPPANRLELNARGLHETVLSKSGDYVLVASGGTRRISHRDIIDIVVHSHTIIWVEGSELKFTISSDKTMKTDAEVVVSVSQYERLLQDFLEASLATE